MSYVLHFYRMTYKTYDMQEYILFILQWRENEPVLGGFAPPATGRTTAVFSMVLDLLLPKHGVHKDTAKYVLSYSKPFELLSKINVDFLPKSENQATCVSFLSLNIHKSVIFLPITSEIHFCVKVFLTQIGHQKKFLVIF